MKGRAEVYERFPTLGEAPPGISLTPTIEEPGGPIYYINVDTWRWYDGHRWWTGRQIMAHVKRYGRQPAGHWREV